MIAPGLLVALILLIALVGYASFHATDRSHERGDGVSRESGTPRRPDIQRWVDESLISEDQAYAIEQFESTQCRPSPPPRISPAIEALAYV